MIKFSKLPIILVGFLTLAMIGCGSEQGDQATHAEGAEVVADETHQAIGVIMTITPTKNYVNIDHEKIPDFMEAMAMFFPVPDTSILRDVAVGDSVAFTLEVRNGKMGIVEIQVLDK